MLYWIGGELCLIYYWVHYVGMPLRQHLRVTQKGDVITYLPISVDVKRLFFVVICCDESTVRRVWVSLWQNYGCPIVILYSFLLSLFLRTTLFSPYFIRLFWACGTFFFLKSPTFNFRGLKMVCYGSL